jgi:twitching motility protein PilT
VKTIEELLRNLARPEVLEFALASDRLPCVKVGGAFQPVDGAAPTTDAILQMLVGVGGTRHIESLTSKPTQWTTRIDGLGVVSVSAIMRNDVVQVRFTLTKREVPPPLPVAPPVVRAPPSQTQVLAKPPLARPAVPQPSRAAQTQPLQAQPVPPMASAPRIDAPFSVPSKPDASRRGPPRERADPPVPRPPRQEEDDEPTLTNDVLSRAPGRGRVLEVPLEIDLDDSEKRASRPSAPALLGDDEPTTEVGLGAVTAIPHRASPQGGAPAPVAQGAKGVAQRGAPAGAPGRGGTVTPVPAPSAIAASTGEAAGVDAVHAKTVEVPSLLGQLEEDPSGPSLTVSVLEQAVIQSAPMQAAALWAVGLGLDELLGLARVAGASDLHIVAGRPALVRAAGELLPRTSPMDAQAVERMVNEIVPRRVRPALEADGSCDFALEHAMHARFRVNVSRQHTGYTICVRVIPSGVPKLSELGLPEGLAAAVRHGDGLVLVTGPSGHGKTTTLAALVDLINRERAQHVVTIEDPIEFLHPPKRALLSQREVGTHCRSFAAALNASLCEDPDVIVVGELRDTETMRAALSASEAGHLVLGTMNTPSAAKTIDRVLDLFPPAERQQARSSLGAALRLIVGQRLVPGTDRSRLVAAVELLPSSLSLATLIRDNKTLQIPTLQQRGRAHGILRLDESLAQLVWAKKADIASARPFSDAPDEFDLLVAQGAPLQDVLQHVMGGQPPAGPFRRPLEEPPTDLGGLLSKAGSLFGGKKGS